MAGIAPDTLASRFTRTQDSGALYQEVAIKRYLTDEEMAVFGSRAEWQARGLHFKKEALRYYPEEDLAAHVLGFVNHQGEPGRGIEARFDHLLRSTPGMRQARVDGTRTLIASLTENYVAPSGGAHVRLTIDSAMQYVLEQALDAALVRAEAPRAMGILMDPDTGAIRALAVRPAYNLNEFYDYEQYPKANRVNRAVEAVFEPGSTFKIVTAAAALEHGLVDWNTPIDCENGTMYIGNRRIGDYHKMGVEPFEVCFAESSNIAMIKLAAKLGPERLDEWIRRFGFGTRTSQDLPAESPGIYRDVDDWSGYSMGSLPMGQEISVTMPQLARAFAVIANGGYLVEPHIVEDVTERNGALVYAANAEPGQRILSAATAETMRDLCHLVVSVGTGTRARIDEYRAAGKTGTAQMARADGKGYEEDKYNTVFAGFAPVRDPELVCVIVVEEPGIKQHYGGYVCGPVFKEVVRECLIMMHVTEDPHIATGADPDDPLFDQDALWPRLNIAMIEPAMEDLELFAMEQDLQALQRAAGEDGAYLPDLRGKTKREAQARLAALGVAWDFQGAGWVIKQEPRPGTPVAQVTRCSLVFAPKTAAEPAEDVTDASGGDDAT